MKFKKPMIWNLLAMMVISLILTGCPGVDYTPTQPVLKGDGFVEGVVTDNTGQPQFGAAVICINDPGSSNVTDQEGKYYLQNVNAGYRQVIEYSKNDYVSTRKVVKVVDGKTTSMDAAIAPVGTRQTIEAESGGTVSVDGAEVKFPVLAFVYGTGEKYYGKVNVSLTVFNTDTDLYYNLFNGEFFGYSSLNGHRAFQSFGFIEVTVTDNFGQAALYLDTTNNKTADITIPIGSNQSAAAPSVTGSYYYDNNKNAWYEESSAMKNAGGYTATIKKLGKWNCGEQINIAFFNGKVLDQDGNPVYNARVTTRGTEGKWAFDAYTNTKGIFKVPVKALAKTTIYANYQGFFSDPLDVTAPGDSASGDLNYLTVDITGTSTEPWEMQQSGTTLDLADIRFVNMAFGWACGGNVILNSYNGGDTWSVQHTVNGQPQDIDLKSIYFTDQSNGYAGGNKVFMKTTDGGENWTHPLSGLTDDIYALYFVDQYNGWMAGSGFIKYTGDGGLNWQTQLSTGALIESLYFIDNMNGWAAGATGKIFRTTDGGENWEDVGPNDPNMNFGSIQFSDMNNGWAVGSKYAVKSNDGGKTWNDWSGKAPEITGTFTDVYFDTKYEGWLSTSDGNIFYTDVSGNDWVKQNTNNNSAINAIFFLNNKHAWACGQSGKIFYTKTGGF